MTEPSGGFHAYFCEDGSVILETFVGASDDLSFEIVPSPARCTDPAHCDESCPTCGYAG